MPIYGKKTRSTKFVKMIMANSANPDQTPQNAASDQGLYY